VPLSPFIKIVEFPLDVIKAWFFAFIIGAALIFFGFGILRSGKSNNLISGLVIIAAGVLTFLSVIPVLRVLAGLILRLGAIALLVLGVWSGILFVINLRKQ
jgi:hypothetical protein